MSCNGSADARFENPSDQYHVIRWGHKRSLIAIAHKLIRVIYTLLKKRQPYIDPDTDYEGLMVRKNASRWLHKLEEYGYLRQVQQRA